MFTSRILFEQHRLQQQRVLHAAQAPDVMSSGLSAQAASYKCLCGRCYRLPIKPLSGSMPDFRKPVTPLLLPEWPMSAGAGGGSAHGAHASARGWQAGVAQLLCSVCGRLHLPHCTPAEEAACAGSCGRACPVQLARTARTMHAPAGSCPHVQPTCMVASSAICQPGERVVLVHAEQGVVKKLRLRLGALQPAQAQLCAGRAARRCVGCSPADMGQPCFGQQLQGSQCLAMPAGATRPCGRTDPRSGAAPSSSAGAATPSGRAHARWLHAASG